MSPIHHIFGLMSMLGVFLLKIKDL